MTNVERWPGLARSTQWVACIPARNEAGRIAACIRSLDAEFGAALHVVLLVNDTTDDTLAIVRSIAGSLKSALTVVCVEWRHGSGSAPKARAVAFDLADLAAPNAAWIFSTDADTLTLPGLWGAYQASFESGFDMVCGSIGFIEAEAAEVSPLHPQRDAAIGEYRHLGRKLASLWFPDPDNAWPHHGGIGGANFAVTKSAYRLAGPIPAVRFGEDWALRRRFEAFGLRIRHDDAPRVATSCRLDSMTEGGLSAELRRNRFEADPLVDEALEPPSRLLRRLRLRCLVETEEDRHRVAHVLQARGLSPARSVELAGLPGRKMAWFHAEAELPCLHRSPMRFSALDRHLPSLRRLLAKTAAARPGSVPAPED
ncbi:glycosyltransferase family 2 protein [Jiella pelagia]|uniref:Glycosyltransferase n=1 Tax=Jiella pelagia TaxID=2986949 RepID=A0ABY7C185_9HYPH|nr:glycosyltransferase [Jiella pelagia]WAP68794.1 glycosyltransferase [Jiella pelagia]